MAPRLSRIWPAVKAAAKAPTLLPEYDGHESEHGQVVARPLLVTGGGSVATA
jgi:hypothetical protein